MSKLEITSKTPEEFEAINKGIEVHSLSDSRATILNLTRASSTVSTNPWTADDVDKFATKDVTEEYREIVKQCRFFYRRDPLASVVINKIVEVAITDLQLIKGKTPANQFRVYESLINDLQEYAESCALEYMISGLVIPEIEFSKVTKRDLQLRGVKSYPSLNLPDALWVRDPGTVVINSPLIANKPSYFVEIPDELIYFLKNNGKYADGTEDKELYRKLLSLYPEFVREVKKGETLLPLDVEKVFRRKVLADSPYPTPFLYASLESLRHKRNLRRMDYSLAARVTTAIQQIKVGDKDFPLVAEDDNQLDLLRQQMRWRDSNQKDIERIFQLFTNHTVEIIWVMPDVTALLDDAKYVDINADIFTSFGFPRILLTGETEKSQTSNADTALISPEKTLNGIRRKIIQIIQKVLFDVTDKNAGFKETPMIRFAPMNLVSFGKFLEGLALLYESGNLSRTDFADALGFDFIEQTDKRAEEIEYMEALDVPEFAPVPHSNTPNSGETQEENDKNTEK